MKKRPQNENTKQIMRIVVKAQALEQQTLGF